MHIYRFINTINGKVYIGKSVHPEGQRKQEHIKAALTGKGYCPAFYAAIRKYGANAFKFEVIHRAQTFVELSKMETFFIILHQSHKPENGYNLTLGGDGVLHSEETIRKISDSLEGNQNRKGVTVSAKTKQKVSQSLMGNKNRVGKKHSEEWKRAARLWLAGTRWKSKPFEYALEGNQ